MATCSSLAPGGRPVASIRYLPASWARFWRPQTVAFDLGSDFFRLAYVGSRSLLELPARVVLDPAGHIAAVGQRALRMEERLPEGWRLVQPVEGGRLSQPRAAQHLVRVLLRQLQRRRLFKPGTTWPEPVARTPLERGVFHAFLRDLPVGAVQFAEPAYAQAIGAGLAPRALPGLMVVDIGAERTGATVLSYGRPVRTAEWTLGGRHFTAALQRAVEAAHGVRVAKSAVEQWKRLGGEVRLLGQERRSGRLEVLTLPAAFAATAMAPPAAALLERLSALCAQCSPALRADIQEQGLLLVGGGAQLPELRGLLARELGMPVVAPEQPARCLVRGLARLARSGSVDAASPAEDGAEAELSPLEA
jgi:rod shape-determining protein MreB